MDDDMSMYPVFSRTFQKAFAEYFDGSERYGIKEDTGEITEVSPIEIHAVRMIMQSGEDFYIGPTQDAKEFFKLHQNLTQKDLERHKDGDGWKPGRFVIENTPGNHQVWVRYEEEVKDPGMTWAKVGKNSKVIHYDTESALEKRFNPPQKYANLGVKKADYYKGPGKESEQDLDAEKDHTKRLTAQAGKKTAYKMSPVLEKVERYFGEYEIGVYKEAQGDKDGAVWKVKPTENTIDYLKAMNAQGKHIFIRPTFDNEDRFMLHDDLDQKGIEKQHKKNGKWKPGRMVVETSPSNYQVWIKSERPLSVEEKKHWLAKMESDPGASPRHRWGRSPGFRNRKAKYRTEKGYPLSRLVWVDWKNQARVPEIELNNKQPQRQPTTNKAVRNNVPNKMESPKPLPTRADYYKGPGKESEQDFAYAMALLRRNMPKDVVKRRIMQERTDWRNHQGEKRKAHYLKTTIDNAERKVLNTQQYNRGRSKREQGRDRANDQESDYKIMVKDIKSGRQKDFTLRNIPIKNAQATLNRDAKKAVASMGYKTTENLEVSIQRLNGAAKIKIIEKHVSIDQQP
jgi:hypothetical protein